MRSPRNPRCRPPVPPARWIAVTPARVTATARAVPMTGPTGRPIPARPTPSRADLHQALLTPRQLPAGWSSSDAGADSDDQVCDFDLAALAGVPTKDLVKADVRYAVDESSGPAVAEVLGYLPGRTDGLLDALRAAL